MKTHSAFFSDRIITLLRDNQKTNEAAKDQAAEFISSAQSWKDMDYNELRGLVFSPSLKRSWFVRSDGDCPACGQSVPMYNWIYDPFNIPWKMKCPHCSALFPKNDFQKYYESGLDESGFFYHEKADRTLLVGDNDTCFGVDDGNGWYDDNGRRYMFIGAYLSHARWKAQVKDGAHKLSFSYVLSGNKEYAYRTAILLDAIAEFWPDFDFYTQGIMYEQEFKSNGYVNYWVDSNREARTFALAYDQVFDALAEDTGFEAVVGRNFSEFSRRVEERILQDSLDNIKKINTNPPETPQTIAIIKSVLNYDKDEINSYIDDLITQATAVDGLSGESGLGGYAAISPRAVADLLCLFSNTSENFLEETLKKHPQIHKTYRFHIDTWYDSKYYPGVGDSSYFASQYDKYTGLFSLHAPLTSCLHRSREWLAVKLSEFFSDPDIAKTICNSYDKKDGFFNHDLYMDNPSEYDRMLNNIIRETGSDFRQSSINYDHWRISILHSNSGNDKTMVAMPYDSGKNHSHNDALSLHVFSRGFNVTPDYGYPAVNHGGWNTKEALWYKHPAAHNQVVVDGKRHVNMPPNVAGVFHRYPEHGQNIMFCDGSFVKATYNSAPEYNDIERNERLAAIIETSDGENYILDISRTVGGNEHTRFLHGTYSELKTTGLTTAKSDDYYPHDTIMRNFMIDDLPDDAWNACFRSFADKDHSPLENEAFMKYTGLTPGAAAGTCESWVDVTRMSMMLKDRKGSSSAWIPTIFEKLDGPATQFTGLLEVYEKQPIISSSRKLSITGSDFTEAVEVILTDGTTDVILVNDPMNNEILTLPGYNIETDAVLCVIRYSGKKLKKAVVCSGLYLKIKGTLYTEDSLNDNIEFL